MPAKFQSQLDEIQTSMNNQNKHLEELNEYIEDQERYSRSFCLRFVRFQEDKGENTTVTLVNFIRDILQGDFDVNEIENLHQIGKFTKGKHRAITARFYSKPIHNEVLQSLYRLKQTKSSMRRLNQNIIGVITIRAF
ncbi:unnamed protein product [Didymodactylos carnosus]|uniref:DUF4806 domain-containing protein n=1 Tax=Didymodactylos carnosus TaxID=1234261 RepID=A0A814K6E0_9BILA|nr:unnamed protein product [Didymodactylos carnosus]CAF1046869.1 unnamed protein product [Didymodactylos carnosus]CAF3678130.1 unnamed protein product [Didymodactylos carnosus]CAF3816692.1 unnamed protein product [Didymodactylos carnosus]